MQAITAPGGTTCWHRFLTLFCRHHPTGAGTATGRWCWPAWPGPDVGRSLHQARLCPRPLGRGGIHRAEPARSGPAGRAAAARRADDDAVPPCRLPCLSQPVGQPLDAERKAEALAACAAIFLRPFRPHGSPVAADWPEAAGLAGPLHRSAVAQPAGCDHPVQNGPPPCLSG